MIKTHEESNEVLYTAEDITDINTTVIEELKILALKNQRQRIRLCTHQSTDDTLHEMFIVHTKECYVRPHKHIGKVESITILEGEVDVLLFHDNGKVKNVFKMGAPSSGKSFYLRLNEAIYHMLLIKTDYLVFHEITEGPFIRESTIFPDWAPQEFDEKFILNLRLG